MFSPFRSGRLTHAGGVAAVLLAASCSSVETTTGTTEPTTTGSQEPSPADGFQVLKSDVTRSVPAVDEATQTSLANDNAEFALDVYAQLAQKAGNVWFSPYSISTAMAMAYVGSRGNTKTELGAALHFKLADEQLHPAFNALDRALATRDVAATEDNFGLTLNTNNDIWAHVSEDKRPLQSYADALAENYSAPVKLVDFDDAEAARTTINTEVKRLTNDTVKELIPVGVIVPQHTVMVLTNTIYLKAAWQTPFDTNATEDGVFNNSDATQADVEFMHSMESVDYATGNGFQAVRLPYVGGELAMTVILPEAGQFASVEQSLALNNTLQLEFEQAPVDLRLPKFEMSLNLSVKKTFEALGVHDAFSEAVADFTGIRPGGLYIQDVLHEAFITIDEAGTEAGAATAVVFGDESAPLEPEIEFTADRPFIVLIHDMPTGGLLFAGRVSTL